MLIVITNLFLTLRYSAQQLSWKVWNFYLKDKHNWQASVICHTFHHSSSPTDPANHNTVAATNQAVEDKNSAGGSWASWRQLSPINVVFLCSGEETATESVSVNKAFEHYSFAGSVTSLWTLMTVCRLVGRLVGWSTLPCSYLIELLNNWFCITSFHVFYTMREFFITDLFPKYSLTCFLIRTVTYLQHDPDSVGHFMLDFILTFIHSCQRDYMNLNKCSEKVLS